MQTLKKPSNSASAPLRLRYQTVEFGALDIHVRGLRDLREYRDQGAIEEPTLYPGNWALFGVLWSSGITLAELMYTHDIGGKRILEVGCGLAIASLVINSRQGDISATDFHPEAENFLEANVALNNGRPIPFARGKWLDGNCGLGTFDLIIASDVLYEPRHAKVLSTFVEAHARKACEVIIVDPGRGFTDAFGRHMSQLGYSETALSTPRPKRENPRECILFYSRDSSESLLDAKDAGPGRLA